MYIYIHIYRKVEYLCEYLQHAHHQKFSFHPSPYSWSALSISSSPSSFLSSNHYSVLCIYELVFVWFYSCVLCFHLFSIFHRWVKSYGIFLLCLTYFTYTRPSRSIYVVTNGKISSLYSWVVFHYPFIHWWASIIHSSVHGHLGCFHNLAVVNNDAVSMGVHVSFQINGFILFSKYPRVG